MNIFILHISKNNEIGKFNMIIGVKNLKNLAVFSKNLRKTLHYYFLSDRCNI